jgi:hypothetical protein
MDMQPPLVRLRWAAKGSNKLWFCIQIARGTFFLNSNNNYFWWKLTSMRAVEVFRGTAYFWFMDCFIACVFLLLMQFTNQDLINSETWHLFTESVCNRALPGRGLSQLNHLYTSDGESESVICYSLMLFHFSFALPWTALKINFFWQQTNSFDFSITVEPLNYNGAFGSGRIGCGELCCIYEYFMINGILFQVK